MNVDGSYPQCYQNQVPCEDVSAGEGPGRTAWFAWRSACREGGTGREASWQKAFNDTGEPWTVLD